MIIKITETTTLAELELLLTSLGIRLKLTRENGIPLAAAVGPARPGGTEVVEAATGSTLAEAARIAVERWCMSTQEVLATKSELADGLPAHRFIAKEADSEYCFACGMYFTNASHERDGNGEIIPDARGR